MDFEQIRYELDAGILTITLDRPDRLNAWTPVMARELIEAFDRADADDDVRAIVITGAGRAYCAGADLAGGGETFDWRERQSGDEIPRDNGGVFTLRVFESTKPVIAAINGPAVGVGITWPLQADIRYVATDAKLAFAMVRRGVIPELASSALLPRLCGVSRAAELLFSGRTFLGTEAVEYGVATKALPAAEVLPAALELARDIAANAAPLSVAAAKRLLWDGLGIDLAAMRRREGAILDHAYVHHDSKEGTAAFFEKRAPHWTGSVANEFADWLK